MSYAITEKGFYSGSGCHCEFGGLREFYVHLYLRLGGQVNAESTYAF